MTRSEIEYRGYWIEVWTRSRLSRGGLEYAAEVRVTADSEEAAARYWTPVNGSNPGFRAESDALESGKRRGDAYVDALLG